MARRAMVLRACWTHCDWSFKKGFSEINVTCRHTANMKRALRLSASRPDYSKVAECNRVTPSALVSDRRATVRNGR